jgi:hypothetical protein
VESSLDLLLGEPHIRPDPDIDAHFWQVEISSRYFPKYRMTKRRHGLRSTKLNLIPVLRALVQESCVTRAGEKLGQSSSAVSFTRIAVGAVRNPQQAARSPQCKGIAPGFEPQLLHFTRLAVQLIFSKVAFTSFNLST